MRFNKESALSVFFAPLLDIQKHIVFATVGSTKIADYSSVFCSNPYDLHISTSLVVCQLNKLMQCEKCTVSILNEHEIIDRRIQIASLQN